MDTLQGAFELYGVAFRWTEEGASPPSKKTENGVTVLVRQRGRFPAGEVSWRRRGDQDVPWFGVRGEEYAYRFEGVAGCLLSRDGFRLQVFPQPRADPQALRFVLARGVIPRLLHLRGVSCLHSSAVRVGPKVVGFLGASGCGKSTVAGALVARGFPLVSDDVVPLRSTNTGVMAGPGLPEVRLYESAAELAGVSDLLVPRGPGETKGRWTPGRERIASSPAPLAALYLLQPGEAGGPERLTPANALLTLIEHSFWLHSGETRALGSDFDCFAGVARSVPVVRLPVELSRAGLATVEHLVAGEAQR